MKMVNYRQKEERPTFQIYQAWYEKGQHVFMYPYMYYYAVYFVYDL